MITAFADLVIPHLSYQPFRCFGHIAAAASVSGADHIDHVGKSSSRVTN